MVNPVNNNYNQLKEELENYGQKGHERWCLKEDNKGNQYLTTTSKPRFIRRLIELFYKPSSLKQEKIAEVVYLVFERYYKDLQVPGFRPIKFSLHKLDVLFLNDKVKNWKSLTEKIQGISYYLSKPEINVLNVKKYDKEEAQNEEELQLECQDQAMVKVNLNKLSSMYPLSYFGTLQNFKGKKYLEQTFFKNYSKEVVSTFIDALHCKPIKLTKNNIFQLLSLLDVTNLTHLRLYKECEKFITPSLIINTLAFYSKYPDLESLDFVASLAYEKFTHLSSEDFKNLEEDAKNNLFTIEDSYIQGICYLFGIGTEKNANKAFIYFKIAADEGKGNEQTGDANGQTYIGHCYKYGLGTAKDEKKAFENYFLAANQGNSNGQYNLGLCYEQGLGTAKDDKKAFENYYLAANQGNANAQCSLSLCYKYGIGTAKDEEKAFKYFQLAANQGNSNAQYHLGFYYENGEGITKNIKKSIKYYQLSAAQGNAKAQNSLARCYQYGIGVTRDERKAFENYFLAANQGNSDSQYTLGFYYKNGLGTTKDVGKALKYFELAANQGNVKAQYALGVYHDHHENEKAVKYYHLAADQGHADAQWRLGHCYREGRGTDKDEEKAFACYCLAADQGNSYGLYNLSNCYRYGIGIAKDKQKDLYYEQLAINARANEKLAKQKS